MSLTSLTLVQQMPGFNNTVAYPTAWLTTLVAAADQAVKRYCKRDLELTQYPGGNATIGDSGFYSGNSQVDLPLRQWPVLGAVAQVAASSNGVALPTATINVSSTAGFDPGNSVTPPSISVQTGVNTWTVVTYTGTTPTSFTGCSGGTGALSSATGSNQVATPVVFMDANGYGGQGPGAFAPGSPTQQGTQLVNGVQFFVPLDSAAGGERGALRMIGGVYFGAWGMGLSGSWGYGGPYGRGKLARTTQPGWPFGYQNIKVLYSAGYVNIPPDLQYAATMLVAQMARVQPLGQDATENLGYYSYSLLVNGDNPELGTIRRTLAPFREVSWPGGQ